MFRLVTLLALFVVTGSSASAQAPVQFTNYAVLQQLYSAQLQSGPTDYIQLRIAQERDKLIAEIQENVRVFIEEFTTSPSTAEGEEQTPLQKQKRLITALENRLTDVQADYQQLQTEKRATYTSTGMQLPIASGALITTDSYPDLLTKLLIAEERLVVLDQQLKVQNDKKMALDNFREVFFVKVPTV